jgi:hypothetical protein
MMMNDILSLHTVTHRGIFILKYVVSCNATKQRTLNSKKESGIQSMKSNRK